MLKRKLRNKLITKPRFVMAIMIISLSVFMWGCSGFIYKDCIDCTQFPLVYQGTITNYTQGVYLETVCLKIDLTNVKGLDDLVIGDIIYIEYVIKQGEFCSPDDKSTYEVYTYSGDKDSPDEEKDYGIIGGGAIQTKYINSANPLFQSWDKAALHDNPRFQSWESKENSLNGTKDKGNPIIPVMLGLSLISLAAIPVINSPYPTIGNSKTKLGALLFGLPLLARTILPLFGVELPEATWVRIMEAIQIIGGLLVAYGVRDALWKNATDVNSKALDTQK